MDFHRNPHRFLCLEIEAVQISAILEDDARVTHRGELDGEFRELGQSARLPSFHVHHVEVGLMGLLAFRDEVHLISVPHGEEVLSGIGGQPGGLTRPKIVQPNFIGLAASVALPGAKLTKHSIIGHLPTIRRETAPTAARHRQNFWNATRETGQGQFTLERVPVVPARTIHHRLIVLPSHDDVVGAHPVRDIVPFQGRGIGEPLGFTPLGRHHIDLSIAVILPGESQRFAVGRKAREHFEAFRVGGQSSGHPSQGRDGVQITGIGEHHPISIQRGKPQQPSLISLQRQCCDTPQQPWTDPREKSSHGPRLSSRSSRS